MGLAMKSGHTYFWVVLVDLALKIVVYIIRTGMNVTPKYAIILLLAVIVTVMKSMPRCVCAELSTRDSAINSTTQRMLDYIHCG